MSIITRFAPSPSGKLHLGGARTAMLNYLFAQSCNGIFKLRIENTDKLRTTEESIVSILDSLNWLGLKTSEKIILQSDNIKRHRSVAFKLLDKDLAYKCFHTEEELKILKKKNSKISSIWRNKKKTEHPESKKYVIRMKIPKSNKIEINDMIQGKITVNSSEIDDFIILRSDLQPTFLLSSAIDDHDMKISHIIRGDDHLTNTFRQFYIFKFLSDKLPFFGHISLILDSEGKKLSKRNEITSIEDFRNAGYLRESLINYLLRLGWSHKNKEIFSLKEAIKLFNIKNIGKSPAKTDIKKLNFLNNYYLKNLSKDYIFKLLLKKIDENKFVINDSQKQIIFKLLETLIERCTTLNDLFTSSLFIFSSKEKKFSSYEKEIIQEFKVLEKEIIQIFKNLKTWNSEGINNGIKKFIDKKKINYKFIGQPLRLLLTYKLNSPPVPLIMEALGKDEVIKRIELVDS